MGGLGGWGARDINHFLMHTNFSKPASSVNKQHTTPRPPSNFERMHKVTEIINHAPAAVRIQLTRRLASIWVLLCVRAQLLLV